MSLLQMILTAGGVAAAVAAVFKILRDAIIAIRSGGTTPEKIKSLEDNVKSLFEQQAVFGVFKTETAQQGKYQEKENDRFRDEIADIRKELNSAARREGERDFRDRQRM